MIDETEPQPCTCTDDDLSLCSQHRAEPPCGCKDDDLCPQHAQARATWRRWYGKSE